eukprot:2921877-Rhodomonas_salina.3
MRRRMEMRYREGGKMEWKELEGGSEWGLKRVPDRVVGGPVEGFAIREGLVRLNQLAVGHDADVQ